MNQNTNLPVLLILLLTTCFAAMGQNKGIITGKVITEDGSPMVDTRVHLYRVKKTGKEKENDRTSVSTETNSEGVFRFENLNPRLYSVRVTESKGYVYQDISSDAMIDNIRLYKTGEDITITLIRGGVITGRVMNADGEPAIAVQVIPIRVKDSSGNPVKNSGISNRITDDRGIYRLYGLSPGTYVIYANITNDYVDSMPLNSSKPIFHPSSGRETATPISVTSGGEVSGIDIQFRSELSGVSLSGIIIGTVESDSDSNNHLSVYIRNTANDFIQPGKVTTVESGHTFGIDGISDGEYELVARQYSYNDNSSRLYASKKITINKKDVSGIELRLTRGASIDGQVVVEKPANQCIPEAKFNLEEFLFGYYRTSVTDESHNLNRETSRFSVESNGEFTINQLKYDTYNFKLAMAPENLYIKSITTAGKIPANIIDLSSTGVSIAQGEQKNIIKITLSDGAAVLEGKIKTANDQGVIPSRMRIYLVPSEATHADNVLRYAETLMQIDHTFAFKNIASGKYWIITKPVAENEKTNQNILYITRNAVERAKLRKEAEEKKLAIELKPCSKLIDYKISY